MDEATDERLVIVDKKRADPRSGRKISTASTRGLFNKRPVTKETKDYYDRCERRPASGDPGT